MIVRHDGEELILVNQTDHSKLVGQFASHWGNATFATPKPFETVARAATFHDFGWLRYETNPVLAENHETPGFRSITADKDQLKSFQWCIDWLSDVDPYSGLIVSMHRTGLWRGRYDTVAHPTMNAARGLATGIEDFISVNEDRQAKVRAGHDEAEVWTNYHLMQVWDLLGLYFCCQDPYQDYIDPVPLKYGADRKAGVKMTLTPKDRTTVAFDPFPFGEKGCEVQLAWKRLPRITFEDQADFRRAYFQAETELTTFTLICASSKHLGHTRA